MSEYISRFTELIIKYHLKMLSSAEKHELKELIERSNTHKRLFKVIRSPDWFNEQFKKSQDTATHEAWKKFKTRYLQ